MRHNNVGHVTNANRNTIHGSDDNPANLFDIDRPSDTVNQYSITRLPDTSAANVEVV